MIRAWFAVGMIFSLVSVIEAQEVNPPVVSQPIPRATPRGPAGRGAVDVDADEIDVLSYTIEFRVLEGKGLFSEDAAERDLTTVNSTVEAWLDLTTGNSIGKRLRKSAHRSLEKTTTAGAAPHPAPPLATLRVGDQAASNATPAPPPAMPAAPGTAAIPQPMATYQAVIAKNSGEDELWEGPAMDYLGITTLAAPRMTLFTKQSATIQMQTSSVLPHLEPLGDGKYQAKYSVAQDLGMKITLAVQPVDGDDASVELSPLEIHITALDGREPVEGLDLEVGKPIISTRSLKTTAKMKLGATRLIAIPSGPKTQAALLLRVKRANVEYKTTTMKWELDGALETPKEK